MKGLFIFSVSTLGTTFCDTILSPNIEGNCVNAESSCRLDDLKSEILLDRKKYLDDVPQLPETHLPIAGFSVYSRNITKMYYRKCGVSQNYSQKLNESVCATEVGRWREDILAGDEDALLMCDAWGERYMPSNLPGYYNQLKFKGQEFKLDLVRPKLWGRIDQCNERKPYGDDGKLKYEGWWFELKEFNLTNICSDNTCSNITINPARDYTATRGVCFPKSCSAKDVLLMLSATCSTVCEYDYGFNGLQSSSVAINPFKRVRRPSEPEERVAQATLIAFTFTISLLIFPVIWETLMDYLAFQTLLTKEGHFSLIRNWAKLKSIKRHEKEITCIDGLRVISIMAVLLGHILAQGLEQFKNTDELLLQLRDGKWAYFHGATLCVDTFFVIGGLLVSYIGTKVIVKNFRGIQAVPAYILYITNRYMRLTPILALGIFSQVAFWPLFGVGPVGQESIEAVNICHRDWWKPLLYIQEWVEWTDYVPFYQCFGWSWYLSCDFWYFLIFPLFALMFNIAPLLGYLTVLTGILGSISQNFMSSYFNDINRPYQQLKLPLAYPSDAYWENPYLRPWARFHCYGIGIIFGWVILKKSKPNGPRIEYLLRKRCLYVITLWIIALGCLILAHYGSVLCYHVDTLNNNYMDVHEYGCATTKLGAAFWNALYRPLWGFGVGLLIYLCNSGNGFIINDFLSADVFVIIARPTYCLYIFHYMIVVLWNECLKAQIYMDTITLSVHFSGLFVIIGAISIILYLLFEVPLANLWGQVYRYIKSPSIVKNHTTESKSQTEEITEIITNTKDEDTIYVIKESTNL